MQQITKTEFMDQEFYSQIKEILLEARHRVYQTANFKMVLFSGCMTAESPMRRLSSICCSGERSGVDFAALS